MVDTVCLGAESSHKDLLLHSMLGQRLLLVRAGFAVERSFVPSALHAQQAVGWHSVFWHRMSSYVGPQVRSRQLVSEAHQQYRSYDLLYCPQGCAAQGSVSATLSNRLLGGALWW